LGKKKVISDGLTIELLTIEKKEGYLPLSENKKNHWKTTSRPPP
jgi:hypothetical protein